MTLSGPIDAPLVLHREPVQAAWIDYNGHMNVAYYLLVFDHASDALLALVGLDEDYVRRTGGSVFVVEPHITYSREVALGAPLRVETHLLDCDAKRLHVCHRMFHDGEDYLAATNEIMIVHVDLATRRSAPMPAEAQERARAIAAAHADLPRPAGLSRPMGLRHKRA